MQWNNKLKVFEIDSEIVEWDIKTANLSICREYKLLTEKQIPMCKPKKELCTLCVCGNAKTYKEIKNKEKEKNVYETGSSV